MKLETVPGAEPPALAGSPSGWLAFIHRLGLSAQLYVLLLVAALPLCAVTAYQAHSAWTSSREIAVEFPAFDLALRRDAQFKVFMEGVSDAVDTGTLSAKAVKAAEETVGLSERLRDTTGITTPELAADLDLITATVSRNRTLAALLPLRTEIQRSSRTIVGNAVLHHARLERIVSDSTRASRRDTGIALAAVLLSMALAFWFGRRLIGHILRVERRAQEASTLNQAIMDAAPIGMMTIRADSIIATANRACHAMHGFEPGELLGQSADILTDRQAIDAAAVQHPSQADSSGLFEKALGSDSALKETEWSYVRKDGSRFSAGVIDLPLHNAAGYSLGGLRMVMDITERKRAAAKVEHMALHDSLTGLPNRLVLQARAEQAITRAQKDGAGFALALIDLDRFKPINDTLGHTVGDAVLKTVAQRLGEVLRTSDTAVRMGGDEFALLLPEINSAEQAQDLGQKVLTAMSALMLIEGHRLHVSASVGMAFYPAHGADLLSLIRNADAAMYNAKARGRDAMSVYDATMSDPAVIQSEQRAELREALANGEFVLHYQPLVDAATGRVCALEALLRWQHPQRGLLAPGEFIPLAEETGLIVPIGAWVLRQSCADLNRLREQGHAALRMAVNVSPRQFSTGGLEASVSEALEAAQLDGSALELEITESVLMDSLNRTQTVLGTLRAMGVKLAIDDFGTGYSSLSYLTHFPVQTVKIDRSFVHQIDSLGGTALLAGAIISMAHSLGLDVVAEGVETMEQHRHLVKLGCERLQGFRFSPAVSLQQLPSAIARIEAMRSPAANARTPVPGKAIPAASA